MLKKISALLLAAAMLVLLAGCDAFSIEPENVMASPRPVGDQQEIEALIANSSGGSYTPVYPSSGRHKSSIIFADITGDGKNDATAVYRDGSGTTHILFARSSGSSYTRIGDSEIDSSRIDRIEYIDTDGDGISEVLVGTATESSNLCAMTLFRVGDTVSAYSPDTAYNSLVTGDFDGDGRDDIITLLLYAGDSIACARLLTAADGELRESSSCELDVNISAFVNTLTTRLSDDTLGVVIDGEDADGNYATQLLYRQAGGDSLTNPLLLYAGYRSTVRQARILSEDIDADGTVEIPVCARMEHSPIENESTVCESIGWSSYDPASMSLIQERRDILCPDGLYTLTLTPEREDGVTARYDSVDKTMTVYAWAQVQDAPNADDKLLTIHEYSKSEYDPGTVIEAVAGETNTKVYTYIIESADHPLAFTDEEVVRSFSPVSDI